MFDCVGEGGQTIQIWSTWCQRSSHAGFGLGVAAPYRLKQTMSGTSHDQRWESLSGFRESDQDFGGNGAKVLFWTDRWIELTFGEGHCPSHSGDGQYQETELLYC